MTTEAFLDRMTRLAELRAGQLIEDARSEARRIVEQTDAESAQEREHALAAARDEARERLATTRARALAETARSRMALQQQIADEMLDAVERALRDVASGPGFSAILDRLLDESFEDAPPEAEFGASPAHVERCRRRLAERGRPDAAVHADPELWDGVAVWDRDHTFRVTNTLRSRYAKVRERARKLAIARLFGGGA